MSAVAADAAAAVETAAAASKVRSAAAAGRWRVACEIRSVPTAVDRTVSPTKILGFFIMEVPDIELHGI